MLDQRVTIERPVGAPDGGGGETIAWEEVATVWARVEPLKAEERAVAGHVATIATHRVTLRWRADVTGGMRILFRGRALRVLATHDPDERRRLLIVTAREERP